MIEAAETVEDTDFIAALNKLTEKIQEHLKNNDSPPPLKFGSDIKHELVLLPNKKPIHRLMWMVNK